MQPLGDRIVLYNVNSYEKFIDDEIKENEELIKDIEQLIVESENIIVEAVESIIIH